MARGNKLEVGSETVNADGYTYTKTEKGWRLKHHIIAEKKLARALKTSERVYFIDGDRSNLVSDNIAIARKGSSSRARRIEALRQAIDDKMVELEELIDQEKVDAKRS